MIGWLVYDAVGRRRNAWFIDALCIAATEQGVHLCLMEAEKLQFGTNGKRFLRYQGREVPLPDFALVRTIAPLLSAHLEKMGVVLFNSAKVSEICNDKRKTHLYFSDLDISMAESFFGERATTMDFSQFDYPKVLKAASGHGGNEVFIVNSPKEAEECAKLINESAFVLQQPIKPGLDVRVYLLDGNVVAAVNRTSRNDFRSNFSLGGEISLTEPSAGMLRMIDIIKQNFSPWFVGIDFTFDECGAPLLNEIEDIVGTRMLYELTEIEIHKELIFSIKKHLL